MTIPLWQYTAVASGNPECDSQRLTFVPKESMRGLELEFFRTQDEVIGYVTSLGLPFSSEEISLDITMGEETFSIAVLVHRGQMRATLPQEAVEMILKALSENIPVILSCEDRTQNISTEHFEKTYTRWKGKAAL